MTRAALRFLPPTAMTWASDACSWSASPVHRGPRCRGLRVACRRDSRGREAGRRDDAGSGPAHSATAVTVDRQGRVTIDERLRDYAHIPLSSKVIVTGNIDCVELWNDGVYRDVSDRASAEMAAVP